MVLVGQPDDPAWKGIAKEALDILLKVFCLGCSSGTFKNEDLQHRRGNFAAMAVRVSFGGGQKVHLFIYSIAFTHTLL